MQTQLLSKDFRVQSLIDQIHGCLTSIQAETEIDPTEQQIETLNLLLTVTQRAHKDIIEQPTIAPQAQTTAHPRQKLPAEDMGVHNLSEYEGKRLGQKLKHRGGSLKAIGDSHSDWAGKKIPSQKQPTLGRFGKLVLPID